MKKKRSLLRGTALLVIITFIAGLASCGTIIYPERRGQAGGKIDVGVAVLDGLGLLLFIIPGVIAFAVDFSTGAIYLPHRGSKFAAAPTDLKNAEILQVDPHRLTRSEIEARVGEKINKKINLMASDAKAAKAGADHAPVWSSISDIMTADQLAAFDNKYN